MKNQPVETLSVIGSGTTSEGTPFYCVPSSSEPERVHLVRQYATRLQCDCTAAQYGRRCAHVAAVAALKQRQQLALAAAAHTEETPEESERWMLTRAGRAALEASRPQRYERTEERHEHQTMLTRTKPFRMLAS
jgi:SWIM zinc finger